MPRKIQCIKPFPKLTAREGQVALLLGRAYNICDTSRLTKVDRSTIYFWLQNRPEFADAVEQARQKFLRDMEEELRGQDRVAVQTLRNVMGDPETPCEQRIAAAQTILSITRATDTRSVWDAHKSFRERMRSDLRIAA